MDFRKIHVRIKGEGYPPLFCFGIHTWRQIRSFINKQSRKELVIETHSLIIEQYESESGLESDREFIVWLGGFGKSWRLRHTF